MRVSKGGRWGLGLLGALLLAVACGGSDDGDPGQPNLEFDGGVDGGDNRDGGVDGGDDRDGGSGRDGGDDDRDGGSGRDGGDDDDDRDGGDDDDDDGDGDNSGPG